ncbi:hypothetical protein ACFV2X_12835 [Streptomyces sp. NPDC059679]|uniref:hypothetical protein n=1 Tax=Streptomyces sp. NPDC059679 TaxID=3346903 RepID=UPI0036909152
MDVKPEHAPRRCSPEDATRPAPGRAAAPRPAPWVAPPRRRGRIGAGAVVPAVAAVALLSAGCGSDGENDKASIGERGKAKPSASAPAARPAGVEKLGKAMGCKPEITTDVDDYRQGVCHLGKKNYVFLSFVTAKGQRDWLDYAQMYGGSFLVGNRWVVSAESMGSLKAARDTLGGAIEKSTAYKSSPSASNPSPSG